MSVRCIFFTPKTCFKKEKIKSVFRLPKYPSVRMKHPNDQNFLQIHPNVSQPRFLAGGPPNSCQRISWWPFGLQTADRTAVVGAVTMLLPSVCLLSCGCHLSQTCISPQLLCLSSSSTLPAQGNPLSPPASTSARAGGFVFFSLL